ncbi:MAG: hypothetical protein K1X35_11220 [Caulobacteraceae bacterium]|nr:hypothetical protein [Caulobacteraceae bacterium]
MRSFLLAAALAAGLAAAAPSAAEPVCHARDRDQWGRDAAALIAAQDAFQANGYDGLRGEMASLEEVISHAPADADELRACGLTAEQWAESPYPMAAMMLGAARVEFGRGAEAEEALRRGLVMDPANATLAAEAGTAMLMQNQAAEAVAITDAAAVNPGSASNFERARLLRVRASAMIDLERLDDAERTLRESLRYEPNSEIALQELEYIAELRAGGERRPRGPVVQSRPTDSNTPAPGT